MTKACPAATNVATTPHVQSEKLLFAHGPAIAGPALGEHKGAGFAVTRESAFSGMVFAPTRDKNQRRLRASLSHTSRVLYSEVVCREGLHG